MMLVTGGAGFIGSNFIRYAIREGLGPVINLDKLTYAGNLANLADVDESPHYAFQQGDICDEDSMLTLLRHYHPTVIVHFAAESHVDRSIKGPYDFIMTNIVGTYSLLNASLNYWQEEGQPADFRFIHISTDEVYGALLQDESPFNEQNQFRPNSPYSASKASSDHLARAYYHTYGLPVIITNCSNNYGPFQFPEKLIPLTIANAIEGRAIPLYGDGMQVRDWLFVEDHCEALSMVIKSGGRGETYNIGGDNEKTNIEVVRFICTILDRLVPCSAGEYSRLITHVSDRLGHDRRYAVNAEKIRKSLGWEPATLFEDGIVKTVEWYLNNSQWIERVRMGRSRRTGA
ncbi:dTDP-glucose 4,6-dehydratase (plasmid) [Peteryoungia desertarenae]|uniref:dTDP-glucose 4,6-dehydratase n=1 Tax=Peteryoungia desertarenae TaxID=1813451 RepID=A0ABX6QT68_9HYPH|nr:dTDP-glucose 4,6-dehydratase [Peteryoungia desertarenae]QLF71699.1 dTDP-glucose 4,6-dehydratase [Peteryoungia desertarenae]